MKFETTKPGFSPITVTFETLEELQAVFLSLDPNQPPKATQKDIVLEFERALSEYL